MSWWCRFGWHAWIAPKQLYAGDRRYCRQCGVIEELDYDMDSGMASGFFWRREDKDS
jgi:hypothetical protein